MKNKIVFFLLIFILLISCNKKEKVSENWQTIFEKSNYLETPRYDSTISYCKRLENFSTYIKYESFGISPQGRELPLLIINKDGVFDAESVSKSKKSIVLINAAIHPGEPDGKDAGLLLLRDIIVSNKYEKLLDSIVILFIPIFNVDGHERFGAFNRINQNGPKEMGWRTTAQNLNLNRDFLKADAPEMKSFLELYHKWNPDFFIDCHTTDGADYQYHITYDLCIFGNMDEDITNWQKNNFLPYVTNKMERSGYLMRYYIAFRNWFDPTSGLKCWAASPIYSEGYSAINNRPGLLIETHMLKDYKTRVLSTYQILVHSLEYIYEQNTIIKQIILKNDAYTSSAEFRNKPFPLDFRATKDCTMIDFKGIDYSVQKSDLSGASWVKYNSKKKDFRLPWFNNLIPTNFVSIPKAYVIPAEWTEVIDRVKLQGVKINYTKTSQKIKVQTYKFSNVKWNSYSNEGRQMIESLDMDSVWIDMIFPPNSAIIETNHKQKF